MEIFCRIVDLLAVVIYLILNFLLASTKLITDSKNPSGNPLQSIRGGIFTMKTLIGTHLWF
jgi:hypothetical protein